MYHHHHDYVCFIKGNLICVLSHRWWVCNCVWLLVLGALITNGCEREAQKLQKRQDAVLRNRISYAMRDLRLLSAALEAYRDDSDQYPGSLISLTSPIPYIYEIRHDPFSDGDTYRYRRLGESEWMLWSVGPDGQDQSAEVIYRQTNGLESSGDIVLRREDRALKASYSSEGF